MDTYVAKLEGAHLEKQSGPLLIDYPYRNWPIWVNPDDQVNDSDGRLSSLLHTGAEGHLTFKRVGDYSLFKTVTRGQDADGNDINVLDGDGANAGALGYEVALSSYNGCRNAVLGFVGIRRAAASGAQQTMMVGRYSPVATMCGIVWNSGNTQFRVSRQTGNEASSPIQRNVNNSTWFAARAYVDFDAGIAWYKALVGGTETSTPVEGTGYPNLSPTGFAFRIGGRVITSTTGDQAFVGGQLRLLGFGTNFSAAELARFDARLLAEYNKVKDFPLT